MSDAAHGHPLVREYLRELDKAMSGLLPAHASELRDQITAHLEDALQPGADDQEVANTLSRLGSPADLAAEAGAAISAPPMRKPRRSIRAMLAGAGRARLAIAGLAILLVAAGISYLAVFLSAPSLQFGGATGWWYPQDYTRAVDTTADGASQTTVPIRSGQQQGFAVSIYNPSDWTQTVIGPAVPSMGWDNPGSPISHIGVSVPNRNVENGGFIREVGFMLPGSIPPHQSRLLRVLWTSGVCLHEGGSSTGIDHLVLRVRVGWFTRTETIELLLGLYLSGPSQGPCV